MRRYVFSLWLIGVAGLIGGCTTPMPMDTGTPDLSAAPDLGAPADMTDKIGIQPGGAGAPCTDPSQCYRLQSPICFFSHLFNTGFTLPTPGGYCSGQCQRDNDCGLNGKCYAFDQFGSYCFAGCSDATTCRHPGYACALDYQICYPDAQLDCDPTQGSGSCMAQTSADDSTPRVPGGCLRQTFEDKGRCSATCQVGQPCDLDLVTQQTKHCIFLDTTEDLTLTPTRDRWKGLICIPDGVPVLDGKPCHYFEDCFPGSECDIWPGGDGRCHPMCVQGGAPACMSGTCQDVLHAGPGGPGLCK